MMEKRSKESLTPTKKESENILRKKPFKEPEIRVYDRLEDITLFTSGQNVQGGTFF